MSGPGYRLLPEEYDLQLSDSLGMAWRQIRDVFGPAALVIGFAPPAISESGDEALAYYYLDEMQLMGYSTAYAFLVRSPAGTWQVVWHQADYVE